MRLKQVNGTLVSINFDTPRRGITMRTRCIGHQNVDPEIFSILILIF